MLELFLAEPNSLPPARLQEAAKRNLSQDCADAMVTSLGNEAVTSFAGKVSAAQAMAVGLLDPEDIVFWWPNIIERLQREDSNRALGQLEMLRVPLIAEMRTLLDSKEPWIQLSGVFGLAKLKAPDISTVVDNALHANQHWIASDPLLKWLLKIRAGSVLYRGGLALK